MSSQGQWMGNQMIVEVNSLFPMHNACLMFVECKTALSKKKKKKMNDESKSSSWLLKNADHWKNILNEMLTNPVFIVTITCAMQ